MTSNRSDELLVPVVKNITSLLSQVVQQITEPSGHNRLILAQSIRVKAKKVKWFCDRLADSIEEEEGQANGSGN